MPKDDPRIEVTIGAPDVADAPILIALVNRLATEPNFLFINPIDPTSGLELVRNHLVTIATTQSEAVLVAREGKTLVGLVTGIRGNHAARRGVIDIGLGVIPERRGRGIGYLLMKGLERWAITAGCHRLQLRVTIDNAAAVALYRKCGFDVEGIARNGASVDGRYYDDFQMAKLIG